eukprot:CAMPEP_0116086840 /NCGR_PEP_ID=MMETSP0327-20121206/5062_1 /TAXON_ID=44447 /ORGANISM="Pseudo-nitzschia delicatissima, Strain B596" /LENGTH=175 /DNA_ID=CAMNT_0003577903 /DNA_START=41 /DNA_END=568 /DNA_ORIENTATION=+
MADDRKQRLKALAARAGRTKEAANDDEGNAEDKSRITSEKPTISFRNYAPTDKSLSKVGDEGEESTRVSKRPRTQEADTTTESAETTAVSSSKALQNALAEAKQDPVAAAPTAANTVATMAPKKINWDLKRDISDKLAKLEKRTQKAIVRILKERLESEAAKAANEDGDDAEDLD